MRTKLMTLAAENGFSHAAPVDMNALTPRREVREMCRECHENGLYVNPVEYPAVRRRQARLRFSLMCNHTIENLDKALNVVEYLVKKYDVATVKR